MIYYFEDYNHVVHLSNNEEPSWDWASELYAGDEVCYDRNVIIDCDPFILGANDALLLFSSAKEIQNISTVTIDTSACITFDGMFKNYTPTTNKKLDLSGFDTSKVTSMPEMFYGSTIEELNLTGWDISKVNDYERMFEDCYRLSKISVSSGTNWKTQGKPGANDYNMFYYCSALPGYDEYDDNGLNKANTLDGYFFAREPKWIKCDVYTKINDIWVKSDVWK